MARRNCAGTLQKDRRLQWNESLDRAELEVPHHHACRTALPKLHPFAATCIQFFHLSCFLFWTGHKDDTMRLVQSELVNILCIKGHFEVQNLGVRVFSCDALSKHRQLAAPFH